MMMMMMIY